MVHHYIFFLSVAGKPTGVKISRTGYTSVMVSWTAPSPPPAGYEVFYQTSDVNRFSGGNTSNTELTLTGLLTPGETYWIFVVAFGEEGAPVLPSPHSTAPMITLCEFMNMKSVSSYSNHLSLYPLSCSYSNPTIDGHAITHLHFLFHYGIMELSRGFCC